jgi:hypothetical protein
LDIYLHSKIRSWKGDLIFVSERDDWAMSECIIDTLTLVSWLLDSTGRGRGKVVVIRNTIHSGHTRGASVVSKGPAPERLSVLSLLQNRHSTRFLMTFESSIISRSKLQPPAAISANRLFSGIIWWVNCEWRRSSGTDWWRTAPLKRSSADRL